MAVTTAPLFAAKMLSKPAPQPTSKSVLFLSDNEVINFAKKNKLELNISY